MTSKVFWVFAGANGARRSGLWVSQKVTYEPCVTIHRLQGIIAIGDYSHVSHPWFLQPRFMF